MTRLTIFTHADCLGHDTGPGHPERPDRLRAVLAALRHDDFAGVELRPCPDASAQDLLAVHDAGYVEEILSFEGKSAMLDGDTPLSPGSVRAALKAAGGAVAAVDLVMSGADKTAFAAIRPPGHHAEPGRGMGFCVFSNAAIAALHARATYGIRKIAIADFDVHHGNGTEAAFAADKDLMLVSSHQMPCYPGTGAASFTGIAHNIINLPLPPDSGSAEFRSAWRKRGLPALTRFAPELLIVSAGFDGHLRDPLAALNLSEEDYFWLTRELAAIADASCQGRLVSLLEGGYELSALASSTAAHLRAILKIESVQ
jgi:acetoin utilization deacetylase AcuC-like enzyme